jgi:ABC-2 type transport system permease protein
VLAEVAGDEFQRGAQEAEFDASCLVDHGEDAEAYALALASKSQDWMFWAVQQTLLFPLLLLAGMLLPIGGGPGWLRVLSHLNPLSYIVDAERALFDGTIVSATVGGGVIAAVVVATLGLFVGTRTIRRA